MMIPVFSLLLIRRQISRRPMWSFGVTEAIDRFEDGLAELVVIMAVRRFVSSFLRYLKKHSRQALSKGQPFFKKDCTTFSVSSTFLKA